LPCLSKKKGRKRAAVRRRAGCAGRAAAAAGGGIVHKILIVEDEPDIARVLQAYLVKAGYRVEAAADGAAAMRQFDAWEPSLVLLDVMLPDTDGWQLLSWIRERSACPVIMLTAMSDLESRLAGLNGGADDYICKPFVSEEVVARVKAVLRRLPLVASEEVTAFGRLRVDFAAREVSLAGRPVPLAPREMDLFLLFASHPNRTFGREELIAAVWGADYEGSDRAVDLSVNRIRQALGDWPAEEGEIVTMRRRGYKFRVRR